MAIKYAKNERELNLKDRFKNLARDTFGGDNSELPMASKETQTAFCDKVKSALESKGLTTSINNPAYSKHHYDAYGFNVMIVGDKPVKKQLNPDASGDMWPRIICDVDDTSKVPFYRVYIGESGEPIRKYGVKKFAIDDPEELPVDDVINAVLAMAEKAKRDNICVYGTNNDADESKSFKRATERAIRESLIEKRITRLEKLIENEYASRKCERRCKYNH